MKIKDITLVYCRNQAQKNDIERTLERYRVSERNGLRYCDAEMTVSDAANCVAESGAEVNMMNLRVIFVLEDKDSANGFSNVVDELLCLYNQGKGLYHGCLFQIIWKIDEMRVSEFYELISEGLGRLEASGVALKIMLLSQRNSNNVILRGIDTETASVLAVLAACDILEAQNTGVFAYETKQLSIMREDVENIVESQIIRKLDLLPKREHTTEAAQKNYRIELWDRFFNNWSGGSGSGTQLHDIKIDDEARKWLPEAIDFCVFAPESYEEIRRALDFFDNHNRDRILTALPKTLADSWMAHAIKVLEEHPQYYNEDVKAFFEVMAQSADIHGGQAVSTETAFDEPQPGLLQRKDAFFMGKLVEQAAANLNRYIEAIYDHFMVELQRACQIIANEIIPAEIQQRSEELDALRDRMEQENRRYIHQEELERYRSYSKDIMDGIDRSVEKLVKRNALSSYRLGRQLCFSRSKADAKGAWADLVRYFMNKIREDMHDVERDPIERIDRLRGGEINNDLFKSNGELLAHSPQLDYTRTDGFCVMSSEISNMTVRDTLLKVNELDANTTFFEKIEGYDNINIVLEYQMLVRSEDPDQRQRKMPSNVLRNLIVWNSDPIGHVSRSERRREDKISPEPSVVPPSTQRETPTPEEIPGIWIDDRGDCWEFSSPDWGSDKVRAMISINVSALARDGLTRIQENHSFSVGQGGTSAFTIDKRKYFGPCVLRVSKNTDYLGELHQQGMRISCSYIMKRRGKPMYPQGKQGTALTPYHIALRNGSSGVDLPILANGTALAATYAGRVEPRSDTIEGCLLYVSRGKGKASELTVYIPSGREADFRLVPAGNEALYELTRE